MSFQVSASFIAVPTGTISWRSSPCAPYWSLVLPGNQGSALKLFLYLYSIRVFSSFDAVMYTEPQSPPSPHEGPPNGIPGALLPLATPSPPFPDSMVILTSS